MSEEQKTPEFWIRSLLRHISEQDDLLKRHAEFMSEIAEENSQMKGRLGELGVTILTLFGPGAISGDVVESASLLLRELFERRVSETRLLAKESSQKAGNVV